MIRTSCEISVDNVKASNVFHNVLEQRRTTGLRNSGKYLDFVDSIAERQFNPR